MDSIIAFPLEHLSGKLNNLAKTTHLEVIKSITVLSVSKDNAGKQNCPYNTVGQSWEQEHTA